MISGDPILKSSRHANASRATRLRAIADQVARRGEAAPQAKPSAAPASAAASQVFAFASLALLVGYGIFLANNFSTGFGGSDSSGYMNSARLLTQGKLSTTMNVVPELGPEPWRYCPPLGFLPRGNSLTIQPTYPLGFPVLLALSTLLAGWHWGPLVLCVSGTLFTLVSCFLSSREIGVRPVWALVGAAALACSSLLIWASSQLMSDAMATTACAAAFYAALRGRRSTAWAAGCGALLIVALMIRPSNFLLLPALCIVLRRKNLLLSAVVGGLLPAIGFGCYNQMLWGKPWQTGYGNILGTLEWAWLRPTLVYYGEWIPRLLPIGLVGLLLLPLLPWRSQRRELLGIVTWAAAFIGFFAFYPCTHTTWWYSRFILPAFPALAILGAAGLDRLATFTSRGGRPVLAATAGAALLSASLGLCVHDWNPLGVCWVKQSCDAYAEMGSWVDANIPETAIISTLNASGTLLFRDRIGLRWDLVSPEDWRAIVAAVRVSGRPLYTVLLPDEAKLAFEERTPATWTKVATVNSFGIWKLADE